MGSFGVRAGCRGARLGGGGGGAPDGFLSPEKGGGTPNLGLSVSSSIGVLGGRGGGGGPGFATFEVARGRLGRLGAGTFANLPASAIGGGALNWNAGRGGEGVLSGDLGGEGDLRCDAVLELSGRVLRGCGGAGAGPRREKLEVPVC